MTASTTPPTLPSLAAFIPLIEATNGLSLGQVCAITDLEPSTIQNWVKRGFVARPINKKYRERQLARILLIAALRDALQIEHIGSLMGMVNGDANDESDDIIAEETLYDYFCSVVAGDTPALQEIPNRVNKTVRQYHAQTDGAEKRLKEALTVMAYAYTATIYKKKAEETFGKMKQET